jgi:endonuclease/exonuclease/phosphatase family metal-dependent hydrolase
MTSPSDPVIVAGDFNDWNGRVNPVLEDKGRLTNAMRALDASARRTWSSHRPRFALDRVYVRNLAVAGIQVLKGAPWHRLSDHLPVRAELVLDGGPGLPAPAGAGIVTPGR